MENGEGISRTNGRMVWGGRERKPVACRRFSFQVTSVAKGEENRTEKVSHVQYSFSFSLFLVLAQDAQDLSENYSARLRRGEKEGKGRSLLAPYSVLGTPQIRHRCVSSPPQPDPPPFS